MAIAKIYRVSQYAHIGKTLAHAVGKTAEFEFRYIGAFLVADLPRYVRDEDVVIKPGSAHCEYRSESIACKHDDLGYPCAPVTPCVRCHRMLPCCHFAPTRIWYAANPGPKNVAEAVGHALALQNHLVKHSCQPAAGIHDIDVALDAHLSRCRWRPPDRNITTWTVPTTMLTCIPCASTHVRLRPWAPGRMRAYTSPTGARYTAGRWVRLIDGAHRHALSAVTQKNGEPAFEFHEDMSLLPSD